MDSQFINLSPRMSSLPSAGHSFWFHEAIRDSQSTLDISILSVGPLSESSESIEGALTHSPSQRARFAYTPWRGLAQDLKALRQILADRSGETILHIYDGGFREFILLLSLIKKSPGLVGAFNFTLSDPWLEVFAEKKGRINALRRRAFQRALIAGSGQIAYFAETRALGRSLLGSLVSWVDYPLFSTCEGKNLDSQESAIDVLFSPCDQQEMVLCLDAVRVYTKRFGSPFVFLVSPRWGNCDFESFADEISHLGGILSDQVVSQSAYERMYLSSKVAVLPYLDRNYYQYQTSGRLLDAVKLGCVMIVPDETFLAEMVLNKGYGFTFNGNSPDSLANEIHKAILKSRLRDGSSSRSETIPTATQALNRIVERVHSQVDSAEPDKITVSKMDIFMLAIGYATAKVSYLIAAVLVNLGLSSRTLGRLAKFTSSFRAKKVLKSHE